ncbi:hypothetical protein [Kribbella sp. CA-247076]|uniref:hypothetical protein n=1 Tax=Kribbella sp. CA-247076 TaxID=3239941 RepID=UPI003D93135D
MKKNRVVAAATVAVVIGVALVVVAANGRDDPEDAGTGAALVDDGSVPTAGLTTVRSGEEAWFLAPAPTNRSDAQLSIENVAPATASPGFEFVEARIFKRHTFANGVPIAWDTGSGDALDPTKRPSSPAKGVSLQAGQTLDDVILLHFRVSTDQRPLEASGVVVGYKQKGRALKQTLEAVYKIEEPPNSTPSK